MTLPSFAETFLETQPQSAAVVRAFHRWLKHTHRPLLQLEQQEIEVFLLRFKRKPTTRTLQQRRAEALRYLDWLHANGLLGFDPRCAWPRSNFPLPPLASQFIDSLVPTLRSSSVNAYRTALRQFHIWLNAHAAALDSLDRDTASKWLQWLHSRGLQPTTRVHAIQQVRTYLHWLEERNLLTHPAETLIRPGDLPKLPHYLPRPLSPDVDAKLQARLGCSDSPLMLGLLLMRRTGLRIGELMALPYGCIRTDPKGNRLLKVPLGKLDTERLVPLDRYTLKILNKLRRLGRRRRQYLLECPAGRKTLYHSYREALLLASQGLPDEHVTSHRLRHTYATTLLAGGMSLVGVMRLLGHKDYRMTLRYAAITDETVLVEYAAALNTSKRRYSIETAAPALLAIDPAKQLSDLARQLLLRSRDDDLDVAKTKNLARRLRRLASEVKRLQRRQN